MDTTPEEYNQVLKQLLTATVPMALLPVRLETRYVQQRLELSNVEHEVLDVYKYVNKGPEVFSVDPGQVFENSVKIAAKVTQLGNSLRINSEVVLGKPAYWQLSVASSKFPAYAASSVAALRTGISQIETQQQTIGELARKLQKDFSEGQSDAKKRGLLMKENPLTKAINK
ncbi:MAG: hypothetical protein IPP79_20690 [Chitinophagaceae bacterium]|nr:hypothetical protein [Chitinophagaceae bacterium]